LAWVGPVRANQIACLVYHHRSQSIRQRIQELRNATDSIGILNTAIHALQTSYDNLRSSYYNGLWILIQTNLTLSNRTSGVIRSKSVQSNRNSLIVSLNLDKVFPKNYNKTNNTSLIGEFMKKFGNNRSLHLSIDRIRFRTKDFFLTGNRDIDNNAAQKEIQLDHGNSFPELSALLEKESDKIPKKQKGIIYFQLILKDENGNTLRNIPFEDETFF